MKQIIRTLGTLVVGLGIIYSNGCRQATMEEKAKERSGADIFKGIILQCAELNDNQPGLSFSDQAKLASELGYRGTLREGTQVDIKSKGDKFYLCIGKQEELIDKDRLLRYLGNMERRVDYLCKDLSDEEEEKAERFAEELFGK
jgi:hypothetical protein